jgi:hypothetical protein
MLHIFDAPEGKTWFRIETEAEANQESELMGHAVAKHFLREMKTASENFKPTSSVSFEENIGRAAHIQREMPFFLTLRNSDGAGLVTAMLPPGGRASAAVKMMVVGPGNRDPYLEHEAAIQALGLHFGLTLDRATCFPYG